MAQRALQVAVAHADTHTCTHTVPMALSRRLLTKENQHSKENPCGPPPPQSRAWSAPQLAQPYDTGGASCVMPRMHADLLVVAIHDQVCFHELHAQRPRAIGTLWMGL